MELVGVIGGGTMGAGIAEVCAKAGSSVLVLETKEEFAAAARERIAKSINRGVAKGKITQEDADAAIARVRVTLDMEEFADRDLVIEAAPEIEALKYEIFGKLDKIVKPAGILATNTSSIPPVIKIAKATSRPPGQVVGVHFFNPVPVMPLVEIVVSLTTSEETVLAVTDYARTPCVRRRFARATVRASSSTLCSSVPVPGCPDARIRLRHSRRHRRGHEGRLRLPDGPADAARHRRSRHRSRSSGVAVRGIRRTALRSAGAASPHGRRRSPRQEDRSRLLRIRLSPTASLFRLTCCR